jgi:acyl-homoserine-lactone acylase
MRVTSAPAHMPDDAGAEILWDSWGVPHIFARDDESLFYAFGWAQMHSHGDLILRLYAEARGRAAEYFGPANVETDRLTHTLDIPRQGAEWYANQSAAFKTLLDAFVNGMNAYTQAHPDKLSSEVHAVLPVAGQDLMAHVVRALTMFLVAALQADSPIAGLFGEKAGSNGWAIAPSRTAGGHALLLIDPHLEWGGYQLLYEAQLAAPDVDAYGVAMVGIPTLCIAFNNDLGWTHTVNTIGGCDLYALTLADGGYQLDGGICQFETRDVLIKVKLPEGGVREERLLARRSVHGPVIERAGQTFGLRLSIAQAPTPGILAQWWRMARARDLATFEAALRGMQLPLFTVIYADRQGHIMGLFNGLVPACPDRGAAGHDETLPGDTSSALWTRMYPYESLPLVIDPRSGWVQNANSPPWSMTMPPLNPDDYPATIAPRGPLNLREQRGIAMLNALNQITFEQLLQDIYDTRSLLADRVLDDLVDAARQYGSLAVRRAADVLARWDRLTSARSRGAFLFSTWVLLWIHKRAQQQSGSDGDRSAPLLLDPAFFRVPWSEADPFLTPLGLANPQAAVDILEEVVQTLKGMTRSAWGNVVRLRYGSVDVPAHGGPDQIGVFHPLFLRSGQYGQLECFGGSSFMAIVEFSDPVRARALTCYGNASQIHSPHRGDQLRLAARSELRQVWRTRAEIMANLEEYSVVARWKCVP